MNAKVERKFKVIATIEGEIVSAITADSKIVEQMKTRAVTIAAYKVARDNELARIGYPRSYPAGCDIEVEVLPIVNAVDIELLAELDTQRGENICHADKFDEAIQGLEKWLDRNRKVVSGGVIVETWWDKRSQNWFTDVLNAKGYMTESDASGNKSCAAVQHGWTVVENWWKVKES